MNVDWEERQDGGVTKDGRTAYERDYARVVHSAAFRRMQAKTQVLGLGDSDFYRTRARQAQEQAPTTSFLIRCLSEPSVWPMISATHHSGMVARSP